jgi:hypothetical protein
MILFVVEKPIFFIVDSFSALLSRLVWFVRYMPREREKNIIQGWATQRQIVQGNPSAIKIAHNHS